MARVLVLGATGFIGRHVVAALERAGHEVIRGVRQPPAGAGERYVAIDYLHDHDAALWVPRVSDVDAVVNAVGILRERGDIRFEALHIRAPAALFRACLQAGVRRVVQISALGADEEARSGYHRSKKAADDVLTALPISSAIVQPSLVYGGDGTSARLFTTMAALPLIPLPGEGRQRVQPVHVDDVAALVVRLVGPAAHVTGRIAAVGARAITMREWLAMLRAGMQLPPARFLRMPRMVVVLGAALGNLFPQALLDSETLAMLERGNTASPENMTAILGRAPRDPSSFIDAQFARPIATAAKLRWLLPVLRAAVAALWIATGIVSLGVYPVEASYALLARTGITGTAAVVALYGAALLDLALGIGVYVVRRRRWLWRVQIALVLAYTAIMTIKLPEYWLHPYGPLTKNLPLLAALLLLHELEEQ
ncbi:MAG: SDR family oxidoreductase [Methanocella sp.]